MIPSDYVEDDDGNQHFDACYHDGKYKGDHSECFWTIEPFCFGCVEKIAQRIRRGRVNKKVQCGSTVILIRLWYHTECKNKVVEKFLNQAKQIEQAG